MEHKHKRQKQDTGDCKKKNKMWIPILVFIKILRKVLMFIYHVYPHDLRCGLMQ